MNYTTITATLVAGDAGLFFEHQQARLSRALLERPGGREADEASADDNAIVGPRSHEVRPAVKEVGSVRLQDLARIQPGSKNPILRDEQPARKVSIQEGIELANTRLASTRDRHHIQPCCALVSFLSLPSIMTKSSPTRDVERSPGRSSRLVVPVPDTEVCS